MIDFNAILTAAFEQALRPLVSRIEALEAKADAPETSILNMLDLTSPTFVSAVEAIASREAVVAIDNYDMEELVREAVSSVADRVAAEAIEEHTSNYDHDQYDAYDNKLDDIESRLEDMDEDALKTMLRDALTAAADSL